MNKISVVVPCFNEEEVLSVFYKKTSEVLNEIEDITYELLFVDDGSKDHTKDILRALSLKDDRCEFISFSRNFGKEAAMFAGLKKSSGDYVVIMDADLQHPPVLLKEMYKAVSEEGYDCCAGKRVDRTGEGKIRNFLSHTFYKVMQKMCKMDMSDGCGDFRMMSRQMVDAILELKEYNRYMKGYTLFGLNLFDMFDFVTAKIMLPLGGLCISIFTGWYLNKKIVWEEVSNNGTLNIHIYKLLIFILKFIAPIGIALIFINELGFLK